MTAGGDDERRAAGPLDVAHAVTRALAASPTPADGVVRVLPVLCEHLGWQAAVLWTVDRTAGRLQRVGGYPQTVDLLDELAACAWRSAAPAWTADPAGDLPTGLVVPILLDTDVLGVIAVSSRDVRHADDRLLEPMTSIACQLAQWLGRLRAEGALTARGHAHGTTPSSGSARRGPVRCWRPSARGTVSAS